MADPKPSFLLHPQTNNSLGSTKKTLKLANENVIIVINEGNHDDTLFTQKDTFWASLNRATLLKINVKVVQDSAVYFYP